MKIQCNICEVKRDVGSSVDVVCLPCHDAVKDQKKALLDACVKAHDALLCLHVCSEDITFADGTRLVLNDAIAKATKASCETCDGKGFIYISKNKQASTPCPDCAKATD